MQDSIAGAGRATISTQPWGIRNASGDRIAQVVIVVPIEGSRAAAAWDAGA
jgi:hypothetical protein